MKTIKAVITPRYEVRLLEIDNTYVIEYPYKSEKHQTKKLVSYDLASYVFDTKVEELEGN